MRLPTAAALLALFLTTRIALIASSYDAVSNWEEPVFLFSATELPQAGWSRLFAHQDDLNHGASLPLVVLAAGWVRLFGTSLAALKGVALLWSTLTLVAMTSVAWRFFSAPIAVLLAALYTFASPALARLNVTLVGSHPEAVLPCTLLLGAYLEWLRRQQRNERPALWLGVALGFFAGLSLWTAYVSLMWVVAIAASWLFCVLKPKAVSGTGDGSRESRDRTGPPSALYRTPYVLLGATLGAVTGFSPWFIQNLWLRPHGAWLWRADAGLSASPLTSSTRLIDDLATSFGFGSVVDLAVCSSCVLALLVASVELIRRETSERWARLPIVTAAWLGLVLLALVAPPSQEGWYGSRFFVPEQAALFWVAALVTVGDGRRLRLRLSAMLGVLVVLAFTGLWPLMSLGNTYTPDPRGDRERGCAVYGLAALPRAGSVAAAVSDIEAVVDPSCRGRAASGLGWGIGARTLADGDFVAVRQAVEQTVPPAWRRSVCGGFYFVMLNGGTATAERRAAALQALRPVCEPGKESGAARVS
jgi:hypothetical protein